METSIQPSRQRLIQLERRVLGTKNFGTKESYETSWDKDFSRLFGYFFRSSNEKRVDYLMFLKSAFEQGNLKRNGCMLDVGCGEGVFSALVARHFREGIFVDRNPDALKVFERYFPKKMMPYNPSFEYEAKAAKFPFPIFLAEIDAVFLGHMLYFHDRGEWAGIVDSALNELMPKGAIFITLHGDEGQVADTIRKFGGKTDDINGFAKKLSAKYGEHRVSMLKSTSSHWSSSVFGMEKFMEFFFMDTGAQYSPEALEAHIEQNFRTNISGIYAATKASKLITITKD